MVNASNDYISSSELFFYKSMLIFHIRSLPQKAVEKPKVVTHRQPRAQTAKIVIFWWPTMPQIQLMLNSSWVEKETG